MGPHRYPGDHFTERIHIIRDFPVYALSCTRNIISQIESKAKSPSRYTIFVDHKVENIDRNTPLSE